VRAPSLPLPPLGAGNETIKPASRSLATVGPVCIIVAVAAAAVGANYDN